MSNGHVQSQSEVQASPAQARFLGSQNPALMKRNVLASFTDVLLLPVTIVPRAVGAGVGAIGNGVGVVGTGVVQGISMLNPQRWVGTGGGTGVSGRDVDSAPGDGYESFGKDGALFEVGEDEDDAGADADVDAQEEGEVGKRNEEGGLGVEVNVQDEAGWGAYAESRTSESGVASADGFDSATGPVSGAASTKSARTSLAPSTTTSASTSTKDLSSSVKTPNASVTPSRRSQGSTRTSVEALDLLLSLDVSLQLIHATRDAIKRLETFAAYPGTTGTRVRETLDDAFCEMLGALGARHVARGFGM